MSIDRIANADNYIVCTSSTRPTGPTEGTMIYETDTDALLTYTGSAWAYAIRPVSGAWVSYTPVWKCNAVAATVGNGSLTGYWHRNGRTVTARVRAVIGSTTSYASPGTISLSVPFAPANDEANSLAGEFMFVDNSAAALYSYQAYMSSSAGSADVYAMSAAGALMSNTVPFTHTNPDYFVLKCTYEAAGDS
jgi:hypothetical protein